MCVLHGGHNDDNDGDGWNCKRTKVSRDETIREQVWVYARRAGHNTDDAVRKKRVQMYEREAGRNENARETTQGNLESDLY